MVKKIDSKELGLVMAIILGKYLFKTDDLHYGYWTPDLKLDVSNIVKAQDNHSNLIISNIPGGVQTILDVGCGAGALAKRLLAKGWQVDCVSPSMLLTREAKKLTGGKCGMFESGYESVETDKKYDLVIFSESYQYINLKKSLEQTARFLKPGGHMLICDFFETDAEGESALGGGHKLGEFYETVKKYPFKNVKDIDITKQTSPNLVLIDDMLKQMGLPIWELIHEMLKTNHPAVYKLLTWKYRKKIDKINQKYFSGARNGENFEKFKSYRLMLYQKQ
ncbi:MAG: class I SAM-dependent methyltransferase [Elusimicrobiota bacterium]